MSRKLETFRQARQLVPVGTKLIRYMSVDTFVNLYSKRQIGHWNKGAFGDPKQKPERFFLLDWTSKDEGYCGDLK